MSALVILLLAALWAAILLPGALRARREHHPVASADGFARTMTALATRQRPSPRRRGPVRAVGVLRHAARVARLRAEPERPARAAVRRRRAVLAGLVTAFVFALVLGWVVGGLVWALAAVSGLALVAYVGLLAAFASRRGGRHRPATPATAAVSAARAEAVRAAVARAPAGPVVMAQGPADPGLRASVGGAAPTDVRGASAPRVAEVSGNAGLVSVRTVPRAGG